MLRPATRAYEMKKERQQQRKKERRRRKLEASRSPKDDVDVIPDSLPLDKVCMLQAKVYALTKIPHDFTCGFSHFHAFHVQGSYVN